MNTIVILILCTFIFLAAAAPTLESDAKITSYQNDNDGKGNYTFSYETSNGIRRDEFGVLVNAGQPDEHIVVQGSYSYLNSNGERVFVHYSADENGYHILQPAQVVFSAPPGHVLASLLGK